MNNSINLTSATRVISSSSSSSSGSTLAITSILECPNDTIYLTRPPEICINENMKLTDTNVITIIIYSVIFFFSAILNIWMLLLMNCNKKTDLNRVQRFMSQLNIADLIVTFVTIPIEIGWKWSVYWLAGDFGCRVFQFLRPLGIYLASFVLISISVDRYYAILNPLSIKNAECRTKLLIYSSWILSILCSIPQMFAFSLKIHPVHRWYYQCVDFNINLDYKYLFFFYQIFVSTITFFLPLIVILFTYGCILRKIVSKSELDNFNETNKTSGAEQHLFSKSRNDRIKKAKIRTLKLTILIVIVFLICWTPYYVISVWYWIDPKSAATIDNRISNFLFIFAVCHCIANPLVYGLYTMNLSKEMSFSNFGKSQSRKNTALNISIQSSRRSNQHTNYSNANRSIKNASDRQRRASNANNC